MKSSAATSPRHAPAPERGDAANEDVPVDRQRTDDDSIGPLWVITIGMGAFFIIAALVLMFD